MQIAVALSSIIINQSHDCHIAGQIFIQAATHKWELMICGIILEVNEAVFILQLFVSTVEYFYHCHASNSYCHVPQDFFNFLRGDSASHHCQAAMIVTTSIITTAPFSHFASQLRITDQTHQHCMTCVTLYFARNHA